MPNLAVLVSIRCNVGRDGSHWSMQSILFLLSFFASTVNIVSSLYCLIVVYNGKAMSLQVPCDEHRILDSLCKR